MSEKNLIRLQAGSGLVFASFLILHLANTVAALFGQQIYDTVQQTLRWYYQFPIVEIVVVGAASFLHIYASLTRGFRRRKLEISNPSLRVKLHRWSGYFILAAFFGHVLATRGPSLIFDKTVDMSYLSFSLAVLPWFFYPYYVLLGTAGFYHLTHGILTALNVFKFPVPNYLFALKSKPYWIWITACIVITLFSILSIGGDIFEINTSRFSEWHDFAARFVPEFLLN